MGSAGSALMRGWVVLVVATPASACGDERAPPPAAAPDPDTRGPYAVGRTTFEIVDHARGDRTFLTDVWYPVRPADAAGPVARYDLSFGFFSGVPPYPPADAAGEAFAEPLALAYQDAPPAPGPFPLIALSHGTSGSRYAAFRLATALASHGFVVAAPDHPGSLLKDLGRGPTSDLEARELRPADLSLTITRLIERSEDPADLLSGRIDTSRIGATGHSFGGWTALALATGFGSTPPDRRVRALMPISPATIYLGMRRQHLAVVDVPVLLLAERHGFFDLQARSAYHAVASADRYLVLVDGARHPDFVPLRTFVAWLEQSGVPRALLDSVLAGPFFVPGERPEVDVDRIQLRYAVAFFARHLAGDERYAEVLRPGADPLAAPGDVFLGGVGPDLNGNGRADEADIAAGTSADGDGDAVPDEAQVPILYVDAGATGAGHGTSWETAYADLGAALRVAGARGASAREIRVAAGSYRPSRAERRESFVVPSGVRVLGGFPPGGAPLEGRDPAAFPTRLSGDLAGNDGASFSGSEDNALNVVVMLDAGPGTLLDGLVISGGRADDPRDRIQSRGGGLYLQGGEGVVIERCRFEGNIAELGGALCVESFLDDTALEVRSSLFIGNAAVYGGAVEAAVVPELERVRLTARFQGCLFAGNAARDPAGAGSGLGGALEAFGLVDVAVVSSTIAANSAEETGGGLASSAGAALRVRNSIAYGNSAQAGPDIGLWSAAGLPSARLDLAWSNLAGGAGAIARRPRGEVVSGPGLQGDDPLFIAPASGDYRLAPGSPCIDAGDGAEVPTGLLVDLDGAPRLSDDPSVPDTGLGSPAVDLGAYEREP